ncbi:uncharacterized protein LOC108669896 [Hyalella azteca]|uniref:Uncharacterized protein LOC108669896 n=1 Tax=Hyalella azteca TaxID=294128 RepID=A0A8B7NGR1_HYAAZ|nr:uncharacterized protein LOC108669896 [Hyalella azteca]XP_047735943.1 uncharacterized protein LOC108669896 [Hyalella azteca]
MLSRLKLEPEKNSKIQEIKERLDAVSKKCSSLEAQTRKLMPPDERWIITSSADSELAVASLIEKRRPSRLVVVSTHTSPISGLYDLLSRLAARYTGNISLLPLDSFWGLAGQSDRTLSYLWSYCSFRNKLTAVYGSHKQIWEHWKEFGTACDYNFRFDCYADYRLINDWTLRRIENVCCVTRTSSEISEILSKFVVTRWHFPDLGDEDVNWMSSILAEYSNYHPVRELVLPRDQLTDAGARQLFQKVPTIEMLYHEPDAPHLESACPSSAECVKLTITNILHWA